MPRRKPNPEHQPELIAEPRAEYSITPQQQAEQEAERERYRERLRLYLKDPAFRQIEGFPIGEDDAILALSDPPYYTACPNPFLGEIIEKWQTERAALRKELGLPVTSPLQPQAGEETGERYHREPFAADVSEGKNDPIYNAHSYHTKVPHKAIMRYILHYTDPGDIVLDGFCGTGMTGVAAQLCGDKKTIESLGYHVDRKGIVYDTPPEAGGKPISRIGERKGALVDLSPAATFLAYNYNAPVDARTFEKTSQRVLAEVEKECSWMYETWHPNCEDPNRVKCEINFTIWSDVFVCPQCGNEMLFWDVATSDFGEKIKESWLCPKCNVTLAKNPGGSSGCLQAERAWFTRYDPAMGDVVRCATILPALVSYRYNHKKFYKKPDNADLELHNKLRDQVIASYFPTDRMPAGDEGRRNDDIGITHVHHFYTPRNLRVMATIYQKVHRIPLLLFGFLNTAWHATLMRRFNPRGGHRPLSGTLYIPSLPSEGNMIDVYSNKIDQLKSFLDTRKILRRNCIIETASSTKSDRLPDRSIDYVFVDPPFGSNLMYSDLNFLWESWLQVFTRTTEEAIVSKSQGKKIFTYQDLMELCFCEFYRILKPGHWVTIEFHNSQNIVWNAIQEALLRAGFVVADVRILDKQQGSFKQYTSSGAVKQDLVISAYKPDTTFERRFLAEGGSVHGAWDFIRQHLEQLPIPSLEDGVMEMLVERQGYLLYDRMVAFHIQRGLSVPLSAPEFYAGLPQRFLDRDSMYFTPSQAAEYDKRRLGAQKVEQLALFVTDEKSALQWLRRELDPETGSGPQTYQDLQPKFIRELHQARHEDLPELRDILDQNFIQDEAQRWYQPNPERQADLDALRQKSLLREFGEYLQGKGRLRVFRSEAVRAGFSHAWKERDYDTILKVAERLPEAVLQEDQSLLMYVHNAALRQQEKPRQMPLM